jgi:AraC family transcriptional regulator
MFRASFGMPPHAWIASQRIDLARTLLRETTLPIEAIAAQCGYANASHFGHRFRTALGAAPLAFRRALNAA